MSSGRLQKRFGVVVRQRRERTCLSQEVLADAAGLHRTYISLLERGGLRRVEHGGPLLPRVRCPRSGVVGRLGRRPGESTPSPCPNPSQDSQSESPCGLPDWFSEFHPITSEMKSGGFLGRSVFSRWRICRDEAGNGAESLMRSLVLNNSSRTAGAEEDAGFVRGHSRTYALVLAAMARDFGIIEGFGTTLPAKDSSVRLRGRTDD